MGKRTRPFALAALLSLVLAACGGGTSTAPSGSAGASSSGATGTSASPSASSATSSASPSTAASASASTNGGAGTTETETAETTETAGTSATAGAGVELPAVDPSEFAGQAIITAGSSTVGPLSEALAERWAGEGGQAPTVDQVGTGGGFSRFCEAAETDIANASRPIEDDERAACIANNREPIELRVGTDALVVAVSSENDFVEELTIEQLAQVFSDETQGTARLWSDIDPSFPAEPIERATPGNDSGTFDYFVEEVFGDEDNAADALNNAANLSQSEDDNVLVQTIENSPNAIGFFGFAYYQENQDQLKAIRIEGVEPNLETAESNEYPLSRPLFIYSAAPIMEEKPQVAAFINFYLTNVNEEIEDVGYFPASEEALNEARQTFLNATGQ